MEATSGTGPFTARIIPPSIFTIAWTRLNPVPKFWRIKNYSIAQKKISIWAIKISVKPGIAVHRSRTQVLVGSGAWTQTSKPASIAPTNFGNNVTTAKTKTTLAPVSMAAQGSTTATAG